MSAERVCLYLHPKILINKLWSQYPKDQTPLHVIGTETGFEKVFRCPRSVSLGQKYPILVSKIKYYLFRKSFRQTKSDQEIRLIYR